MKQLELLVKDFLDKHESLKMYSYYDCRIACSDINRRPDFVYLVSDTHVICIEVDEDSHRYYNRDCEIARVSEIMQACEGKPLFLIRFNPLVSLLGELKSTFDAFRTDLRSELALCEFEHSLLLNRQKRSGINNGSHRFCFYFIIQRDNGETITDTFFCFVFSNYVAFCFPHSFPPFPKV